MISVQPAYLQLPDDQLDLWVEYTFNPTWELGGVFMSNIEAARLFRRAKASETPDHRNFNFGPVVELGCPSWLERILIDGADETELRSAANEARQVDGE